MCCRDDRSSTVEPDPPPAPCRPLPLGVCGSSLLQQLRILLELKLCRSKEQQQETQNVKQWKASAEAVAMIDLSFLTEEEQGAILAVLKRDAELKKAEEHRVQKLQTTVGDRGQLRYLTGEWFYETKQLRHQDRIHGSDIIRASMRHTHKPLTIRESATSCTGPVFHQHCKTQNVKQWKASAEAVAMIDLSFLTEEEQGAILAVLKRDAELKKAEEHRVQKLQTTVGDRGQLRYLTGEWFYETKQLRHQDRIHGSDIIRASMRHTHKPLTILELSQMLPEQPSFVDSENRDVFVPPVLCGLLEEPHTQRSDERFQNQNPSDPSPHTPKAVLQSPTKRENPFNSELNAHHTFEQQDGQLSDEDVDHSQKLNEGEFNFKKSILRESTCYPAPLPSSDSSISCATNLQPDACLVSQNADSVPVPIPENTAVANSQDCFVEVDGAAGRETNCAAPRGILKHLSTSSSTDSLLSPLDLQSPVSPDSPTETWMDRKQVKFSSMVSQSGEEWQNGKELGEHSLLDNDSIAPSEMENSCLNNSYLDNTDNVSGHRHSERLNPVLCSPDSAEPAFNAQKQWKGDPVSLPRQSNSSPQEDRPAKITELKHFWETEYTGTRVITAKMKEASRSAIPSEKGLSPQSDLRTPLDNREKSEGEGQMSPHKAKSNIVLKSLKVTDKGFVSQSPDRSPVRSAGPAIVALSIDHRHQVKVDTEPRERPLGPSKSQIPRSKEQDNEVRMSPSKTCHPRVLPRESSSPKRSRLEASPLKTFPIDINPQTKVAEEQHRKPSPVPGQKKSPSHGAKQTVDHQYYLGPQEKAHVPPFHPDKCVAEEADAVHSPQSFLRDFEGNQGHDSPIVSALKRLSSRMSSSKSLENLTSQSREEHDSRQQMNSSVDDASSLPPPASSLSNSKQMKTSVSVPVLQQDETDSDSTFENNLGRRRNTGSSTSNISLSSGMASMSSVSGSVSSISPADFGDIEVQGNIQLAVNYIQKLGEFHIFVVHCRELAVADSKKNRSDPYVKCYLVPDKTKLGKRKTTVRKKNLNPNYNEILRFKIIMEVLKTERLNVSVWHNDTFGRNSFLGEVDLDLSEWDFSNTQINEYALKARESAQTSDLPSPSRLMDSRGQMRLALRFLPQTSHSKRTSRMETGEVQIWVKDCKSLPSVRGVMIDPFVKCTVLPDRSRKSRQKTRVVKRTANPMFNHTMVYDGFRAEDLREACVEITVWDHDRLNSHYIGGLRLGLGTGKSYGLEVLWMDSTTAEADLWQRMLQSDGEWVEEVLPLRMFVLAKSNSK
ncbi:putative synaptotagmin-like protein 2 [Scophthalmus maximus]|uniref:Synaptotagmin-like protein 2 n=1 Tax=Scophthalmus maximus TaxID=52904 RepID=A0A2U9B9D8_SCOMX|nr:putative synaptotagmin-like protein 2 [Scophthalmus maximus]